MDSFNLKQFLVENKLTENSKLNEITINPQSTGIKLGGDSPFFSFVKDNKQENDIN